MGHLAEHSQGMEELDRNLLKIIARVLCDL